MTFLSPIALLLLIPWAGVVAWVLMGRPGFARISTTQFWDRDRVTSHTRRGIHKPPFAYVLLLIAMLAGILSASGLSIATPQHAPLTLIVDRSMQTIAGIARDPQLRGRALLEGSGPVDLIVVPGGELERLDQGDAFPKFGALRATAADTSALLDATVRGELARTDQPVRVVTSQKLSIDNPRVTVIAPDAKIENAAIEAFAVVDSPKPQAMVRVRNNSAKARARLRVDSAERAIELPPRGTTRDYFVDLSSVGEYAIATLVIDDDIAADNRAYLARVGTWARVEARSALPASVGKLIGVYAAQRPAPLNAPVVAITTDDAAPSAEPSIVVATVMRESAGGVMGIAHPVTQEVDWSALLKGVPIATNPPAGTPLLMVGDQPVLVELANRSLWVGFDVDAIGQRAEFVIFFTRAIDYVARADQRYTAEPTRVAEPTWERLAPSDPDDVDAAPGVFSTPDGLRALNVAPATSSLATVSSALRPTEAHIISLRPMWALGALLTGLWGSVRLTRS